VSPTGPAVGHRSAEPAQPHAALRHNRHDRRDHQHGPDPDRGQKAHGDAVASVSGPTPADPSTSEDGVTLSIVDIAANSSAALAMAALGQPCRRRRSGA
jgi:hypothetical protein